MYFCCHITRLQVKILFSISSIFKSTLLIVVLTFYASHGRTQAIVSAVSREQFISGCAQYRSLVIRSITDAWVEFEHLCDSLQSVSEYPRQHEKLRLKVIEMIGVTSDNEDRTNVYTLFNGITENKHVKVYKKWLDANFHHLVEYSVLVGQNLLEEKYPYKLKMDTTLWKEIEAYELKEDMVLVDIGTGGGHFPFILALGGYRGMLYMTELDSTLVNALNMKKDDYRLISQKDNLHVIQGDKRNASLGSIKADKIFFRETFHHIRYKKEMLESIRQNIRPGGFVYVKEVIRDNITSKKANCNKIIFKDQIIEEFQKAGYRLLEEINWGEYVLLTFSL